MTDINHVTLVGRLTRDLGTDERSFGYVANGQARANISIAATASFCSSCFIFVISISY